MPDRDEALCMAWTLSRCGLLPATTLPKQRRPHGVNDGASSLRAATFALPVRAFLWANIWYTRRMSKNPVGRPRTKIEDLPENWEEILRTCGQEGGSAVEARCLLGIGDSAWGTLLEDSDEFRRTEKERQALCEVWWERRGREMATGSDGNATVWIFNMKNRFAWRDRHDLNHESEGGSMSPKSITTVDPIEAAKQYQEIMGGNE